MFLGVGVLEAFPIIALGLAFYMLLVVANVPTIIATSGEVSGRMSFFSIDGRTLVVQLVNFAIFFVVLNFVFLRPVSAAIRKRREYINSLVTDYDQYQARGQESARTG